MNCFNRLPQYLAFAGILIFASVALGQSVPLCDALVDTGYGLIGDTLYPGTPDELILNGFVRGHSAYLQVIPYCRVSGAQYRFYRTPYGASVPDYMTSWLWTPDFYFDGGGEGAIFKYEATTMFAGDTSLNAGRNLWLMHDWYPPFPIGGIWTIGYDTIPRIVVNFPPGRDGASGVYKYYIYRARNAYEITYISTTLVPRDSILDDGRLTTYSWTDHDLSSGECYYYTIAAKDKAGWIQRSGNQVVRACATPRPPLFPPCALLRPVPRYHTGSGITIYIDLSRCSPDPGEIIQYKFRKYPVWKDARGVLHMDSSRVEESPWTGNPFYYFTTLSCSTYTFSSQARYLSGLSSGWYYEGASDPLTTNDDISPDCIDFIIAESRGEDGILVRFGQNPNEDCGSGIMGYHLLRIPIEEFGSALPLDSTDLSRYRLWTYLVNESGLYTFGDDGPTDPIIDLVDNKCYYYIVSVFDSTGNINWLDCGDLQIDTACVDKGVAPPVPIPLPTYSGDGTVNAMFIDTTHCDALEVEVEWSANAEFSGASYMTTTFIPIRGTTSVPGVYTYHNPDDFNCADNDTLRITITGLYEHQWFFRARFKDIHGNLSQWSSPTIATMIDNTAPTTARVEYIKSIADSVNRVDIKIGWKPANITDAGIGVQGVKIYRSNAIGTVGSPIATLSRTDSVYIDRNPVPGNNWHNNVYTVVPFDFFGHENTSGGQGYFRTTMGSVRYRPPTVPRIDTVIVSYYLDEFTVVWSDTGPSPLTNRYVMRHAGDRSWLWLGDTLLAPNEWIGTSPSHRITLPIEKLAGGARHYFMMHALDADSPSNESGWSQVFEFVLPAILRETVTIHLTEGWNFISLPVVPDNRRASVIFPGFLSCQGWDPLTGAPVPADVLQPGKAYWILTRASADYNLTGIPVIRVGIDDGGPGWWSIGAPYDSIGDGSGYRYIGTGATTLYGWNPAIREYYISSRLHRGKGYWVLFTGHGDLNSETGMSKIIPTEYEPDWRFTINAGGKALDVIYAEGASSGIDVFDMVLPPPPPMGETVPCFIDEKGFRYSGCATSDGEWTLATTEPIVVSWNISELPDAQLTIETASGNHDMRSISSIEVFGVARIKLGAVLPKEFSLGMNRPNPFNAVCAIPFAVPMDTDVRISIYDINGRSVRTLLDKKLDIGEHIVVWDGKDDIGREMPAGVYLYKMDAGEFSATRRMLLVK